MKKPSKSHAAQHSPRRPRARPAPKSGAPQARAHAARRAVVVLGMHRSGTSALTRVINLLGADLPKTLLPPTPGNEAGYWESFDLAVIHDELLTSAGSHWHDWRAFNPGWYASPAAAMFRQRILNVLRNDFDDAQLFVIKDPRICRFWPFYQEVLDEFGAKPGLVIPIRNPLEVMASLGRRDGFAPTKSGLLWLRHVLDAEQATRDLPRAVVTFDALLSNWQGVVAALGSGLRLRWPGRTALVDLEIEQSLMTGLRHHTIAPEQLAASAEVVDWVKEAYASFVRLSVTAEHKVSIARLDRIRAEFEKASSAFGVALLEGESELAERQAENTQFRAENADLQQRIAVLSHEQQRLRGESKLLTVQLTGKLQSALSALSAEKQKATERADQVGALETDQAATLQDAQQLRAERHSLGQHVAEFADQQRSLAANAAATTARLQAELEAAQGALEAQRQTTAEQAELLATLERDRTLADARTAEAAEKARQLWAEYGHIKASLSAERQWAAERVDHLAYLETVLRSAREIQAATAADADWLRDELATQMRIVAKQYARIGILEVDLSQSETRAVQLKSALEAAQRSLKSSTGAAAPTPALAAKLETELTRASEPPVHKRR
jgi:hypothetical protein